MTNINEYLNNILNINSFDAYMEEDDKLWELYEKEDNSFFEYCAEKNIDLTIEKIVLNNPIKELTLWAYDHCE